MPRPFRFGFVGRGRTREEMREVARRTEDLGFSTLLVPDHFSPQLAPLLALLTAAEATNRLRLGTNVLDNDFRHPALLAKEAATLDVLSGGRFELGIGAGWSPSDYEQTGIPFDSGAVRLARMAEALRIIRSAFGPEPLSFEGQHYRVRNLNVLPKPAQPRLPILLGASRRGMLELAAREADIIGLEDQQFPMRDLGRVPRVANCAEQVAIVRRAAGARFDDIELSILVARIEITADQQGMVERVARELDLTTDQVRGSASFLIGSVDAIVEQLQERRERIGLSYPIVFGTAQLDEVAKVVSRLAGT